MPDNRLEKALQDVPQDSSPADGVTDDDQDQPGSPAGNQDGNDQDQDKSGRTIDNVRGELMRKLDQRDTALQELRNEVMALRAQIANQPAPVAQPQNPGQRGIDQMSVSELRVFRNGLPEDTPAETLRQLDDYIIERAVEEKARDIYRDSSDKDRFRTAEIDANRKATERWPELKKRGSPFFNRVNQILQEMGPAADKNPAAVLHAANEAGFEMGMSPAGGIQDQRVSRKRPTDVSGDNSAPVGGTARESMSDAEIEKLSRSLANALPPGKKFDKDRIKQRDKFYKDNSQYYVPNQGRE